MPSPGIAAIRCVPMFFLPSRVPPHRPVIDRGRGRGQPRRADTAQLGPNARLPLQRLDPASRGRMRFGMRWLLLLLLVIGRRIRRPAPLPAAPCVLGAILATVGIALPAQARVERIEILERAPFAEGAAFGEVGSYERITGRL